MGIGLVLLVATVDVSRSANILAVFSFPGMSNFIFNKGIVESLHKAGHHITFLTVFASEVQTAPNFTVVDIRGNFPDILGIYSAPELAHSSVLNRVRGWYGLEEMFCDRIVEAQVIQVTLKK